MDPIIWTVIMVLLPMVVMVGFHYWMPDGTMQRWKRHGHIMLGEAQKILEHPSTSRATGRETGRGEDGGAVTVKLQEQIDLLITTMRDSPWPDYRLIDEVQQTIEQQRSLNGMSWAAHCAGCGARSRQLPDPQKARQEAFDAHRHLRRDNDSAKCSPRGAIIVVEFKDGREIGHVGDPAIERAPEARTRGGQSGGAE